MSDNKKQYSNSAKNSIVKRRVMGILKKSAVVMKLAKEYDVKLDLTLVAKIGSDRRFAFFSKRRISEKRQRDLLEKPKKKRDVIMTPKIAKELAFDNEEKLEDMPKMHTFYNATMQALEDGDFKSILEEEDEAEEVVVAGEPIITMVDDDDDDKLPEKRKRGRRSKKDEKDGETKKARVVVANGERRGPGRPRKIPTNVKSNDASNIDEMIDHLEQEGVIDESRYDEDAIVKKALSSFLDNNSNDEKNLGNFIGLIASALPDPAAFLSDVAKISGFEEKLNFCNLASITMVQKHLNDGKLVVHTGQGYGVSTAV